QDQHFSDKRILILDPDDKLKNDRTWCFWQKGSSQWDAIVHKQWHKGMYFSPESQIDLDFGAYIYKKVRGIDFYNHARTIIAKNNLIHWLLEEVKSISDDVNPVVRCESGNAFACKHVFDSRIPDEFVSAEDEFIRIQQHFLGWVVKLKEPRFNPDAFTVMDIRVVYNDTTCFTYVLPTSPYEALVEFTLFTPGLIRMQDYESCLKQYMIECVGASDFEILETEYGIIPMTDFPFSRYNTNSITRIGTGGGWVKPATGYSFMNASKFSKRILQNLVEGEKSSRNLMSGRHRKYDILLLDIFSRSDHLGNGIFKQLWSKNPAHRIFSFLDETTSFSDDVRVISSLKPGPFLKALARQWKKWI
ncbi:MAG: lycopene cyclase family protein, partial [Bacteroidota bacterium]